jgi:hypothetical protein
MRITEDMKRADEGERCCLQKWQELLLAGGGSRRMNIQTEKGVQVSKIK